MSEHLFRNELSPVLTIVVQSESEDGAREELARIGLHPSFFQLVNSHPSWAGKKGDRAFVCAVEKIRGCGYATEPLLSNESSSVSLSYRLFVGGNSRY